MNPITDLPGFEFLIFYGLLIVLVVNASLAYLRSRDDDRPALPPPDLAAVDPYEVAVLRDGPKELMRVLIVSLVERGYLELRPGVGRFLGIFRCEEQQLVQTADGPTLMALSEVERTVYAGFATPRSASDAIDADPPTLVVQCHERCESQLRAKFLVREDDRQIRHRVQWAAALILCGVAFARIAVAFDRNEPSALLATMLVFGLQFIAAMYSDCRRTAAGDEYLARLKDHLADLPIAPHTPVAFAAAVVGVTALNDTALADLKDTVWPDASGSSVSVDGDGGCGGCGGCG